MEIAISILFSLILLLFVVYVVSIVFKNLLKIVSGLVVVPLMFIWLAISAIFLTKRSLGFAAILAPIVYIMYIDAGFSTSLLIALLLTFSWGCFVRSGLVFMFDKD